MASKIRPGFPQRNRNTTSPTNYTNNASVQVMLFKNRLEIWNPGQLPYELTTQQLYKPHKSHPNNPLIAVPLQRSGFIEKAGTGTGEIVKLCLQHSLKKPLFEQDGDFKVIIWRQVTEQATEQAAEQVTEQVQNLLNILASPMSIKEILTALNLKHRPTLLSSYIKPAIALNLVEMTNPASPKSPKQKYRLTKKGKTFVNIH